MIRRNIGDRRHVGMEIHDRLQLEAGNLRHHHRIIGGLKRVGRIRLADIAHHENTFKMALHDLACKRGRRRLSVGSRDRRQFSLGAVVGKLDLTPDWDLRLV